MTATAWARLVVTRVRRLARTDARPLARRNARADLSHAIRGLRAAVDREWPTLATRKRRSLSRDPKHADSRIVRKLRARGWIHVSMLNQDEIAARIPARRGLHGNGWWIPGWVRQVPEDKLAQAKRSPRLRKALIAEAALTGRTP